MRGFRGINPKQMERMMHQLGISVEEIETEEVIIKTPEKDYIFLKPNVTVMLAQGQKTFQIVGDFEVKEKVISGEKEEVIAEEKTKALPESDIELVAEQANVSKEDAKKALEECNGNIAEAILKLISKKQV